MTMPESLPPDAPRRTPLAIWLIVGTIIVVSCAAWSGFARPHYAGAVVLQVAVLALAALLVIPRRAVASPGMTPTVGTGILLLYIVWIASSWLWAPEERLSAIGSITAITGPLWAVLVAAAVRRPAHLRWALRGVVAAGAVASVVAIYTILNHWRLMPPAGPSVRAAERLRKILEVIEHVQGHRNFLAIFLLPPLTLVAAELLAPRLIGTRAGEGPLRLPRAWMCAVGALMLVVLLACQSWGAMVGLLAGLACVAAVRLSPRWRRTLLAAGVVVALLGLVTLSLPPVEARLARSAQSTRWFMWQGAARMAFDRPISGWGTGMFVLRFADYKPTAPMRYGWLTSVTIYPHNELLLVLVEGGLVALALYLAAHVLAARAGLRAAGGANDPVLRLAGWAIVGGLGAMFLHGLVEVSLRFWAPMTAYWTMLGLLMAYPRVVCAETQEPNVVASPMPRAAQWALFGGVLLAAVAGAWGVVWSGAASEWYMGGVAAGKKITLDQYIAFHERSAQLSRYVPDYLVTLTRRGNLLAANKRTDEAIAIYERLEDIAPGYGPVRRVLAEQYVERAQRIGPRDEAAGQAALKQAIALVEKTVEQNPFDPAARMDLARYSMMVSRRNLPFALEHAERAVESARERAYAAHRGPAHLFLAGLLAEAGRRDEALEQLDHAAAHGAPAERVSALRRRLQGR